MIELNHTYLACLVFSGFRFVLCIPDVDHNLTRLHPLKQNLPAIVATAMNGYVLSIVESEIFAMAEGMEDYRFCIAEDIFEVG